MASLAATTEGIMIDTFSSNFVCGGCNSNQSSNEWCINNQPAVQNYRFKTALAALEVKRLNLRFVQCRCCGLITNKALDLSAIPFDSQYDNDQHISPVFQKHTEEMISSFTENHQPRFKRILEVGCGKGDFLQSLCAVTGSTGVGYDTTYEGPPTRSQGKVEFYNSYATTSNVEGNFDAIICRHVVQHVPLLKSFLESLRDIAVKTQASVVCIEAPSFDWTFHQTAFWDFCHEQCNYLPSITLPYLAQLSGLELSRRVIAFGGQYEWLEFKVSNNIAPAAAPVVATPLETFASKVEKKIADTEVLLRLNGAEKGWAIWGAAAKGIALANQLTCLPAPRFLIDINPAKQGCYVSGTGIQIIAPEKELLQDLPLVLIANGNYTAEINQHLKTLSFQGLSIIL